MSKNPADRAVRTEYGRYHRMAADGFKIVVEPAVPAEPEFRSVEPREGRSARKKPEPGEPSNGRKIRIERGRYSRLVAEGSTIEIEGTGPPAGKPRKQGRETARRNR